MRRIFFIVITILSCAFAVSAATKGKCGENVQWTFDKSTGVLTISGEGPMKDYDRSPWRGNYKLKEVIVEEGVTTIGSCAFWNCLNLQYVSIPTSVKRINYDAFCGCKNLTSVILPEGQLEYIGVNAFLLCKKLSSVRFPSSLKEIDNNAFAGCKSLTSVTFREGLSRIGKEAFENLKVVHIPSSVTRIGDNAFESYGILTTIYTASSAKFNTHGVRIIRVEPSELYFYNVYSEYARQYVEDSINGWQKKGEFERTSEWQIRVNDQTRQQKIEEYLAEAERKYIAFRAKKTNINPTLGKYDADNEVFVITDANYGTAYIPVPYEEAQEFKANWGAKKMNPQWQMVDDKMKLSSLTITMPNGKQYTYRNTDAVNYNLAEVEYDFEPVEFDLPKTSIPHQNQQNNTIRAGKSAVDTDIPTTNASNPNTFAIIFANEDYKNVASVPFAKNDGAVFQKYCQKTLGIPTTNIHYVENASYNDIRIQLAWLKDVCDAFDGNASVIVYYAGHGIPDEDSKSAYLLPVDGDSRYVQSAYKIDDFYQKLGAMNAKSVTVFVDACFSGSKREQGMLSSARGVALKVKAGTPQGNMVVFSAATGDETAYPNNEQQHGMFTYYLLKKLQETKGDISLKDLGDYITTNVRQQSIVKNGKTQTPTVTPSASVGSEWQNWKLK